MLYQRQTTFVGIAEIEEDVKQNHRLAALEILLVQQQVLQSADNLD
jgi:hypothetical protein